MVNELLYGHQVSLGPGQREQLIFGPYGVRDGLLVCWGFGSRQLVPVFRGWDLQQVLVQVNMRELALIKVTGAPGEICLGLGRDDQACGGAGMGIGLFPGTDCIGVYGPTVFPPGLFANISSSPLSGLA